MKLFYCLHRLLRVRKFFWSLLHAFILIIVTYFVWNIPHDWSNSGKWLQRIHLAKAIVAESDTLLNDMALINTCYDHSMIPAYDKLGIECGQIDVTNRSKLLALFHYLQSEDNYKYIVCDIEFDSKLKSAYDKQLFSIISKMPRCVVARSSDVSIPKILNSKSAISEYHTNVKNSNFLKYQYLSDSGESMALRMAKDLNKIDYNCFSPFYILNGKLCLNSHILDIKVNVVNEYQQSSKNNSEIGTKNILQLGTDVLPMIDLNVKGLFANKIVMIGDFFLNDIHTTVAGPTSGLMIIYNAYLALINQDNVPPFWVWILLMLVYMFLTLSIINNLEPHDILPARLSSSSNIIRLTVDWIVSTSFLLLLVLCLIYAQEHI